MAKGQSATLLIRGNSCIIRGPFLIQHSALSINFTNGTALHAACPEKFEKKFKNLLKIHFYNVI